MVKLFKRTRGPRRVAVLGCGPAGLFAAHAFIRAGWGVTIFSKARKSEMFGAQYLHRPIPGLSPRDVGPSPLRYELRGSAEGYRDKVYASSHLALPHIEDISVTRFAGQTHDVWDIREAYDEAWELYGPSVQDRQIDADFVMELVKRRDYQKIFSTVPAPSICYGGCVFRSAPVWSLGDAPTRVRGGELRPQRVPFTLPAMTVVNSGEPDVGWYRASNIFGFHTIEWPEGRKPPIPGVARVEKPTGTNCQCFMDEIYRGGRYGAWDKLELSHHSYERAEKAAQ